MRIEDYILEGRISIHALREEGDVCPKHAVFVLDDFYPRPPRGGRPIQLEPRTGVSLFLSTPSARRATIMGRLGQDPELFLSTPSARRATALPVLLHFCQAISIHALREEGDSSAA